MTSRAHAVMFVVRGEQTVRWIHGGREMGWAAKAGSLTLIPCDGKDHAFVMRMSSGFVAVIILIPRGHLRGRMAADGVEPTGESPPLLVHDDPNLVALMARLMADGADECSADQGKDEAARSLLLRLGQLTGGGVPDWTSDAGTQDGRTVADLVDLIDSHLRRPPALADLAAVAGLSPSHFARRFRHATGLSLQRFVNRRRLRAALDVLQHQSAPLSQIALDLGFASQSHFTRTFSGLTGMTPAKYRRQFRRTQG